jgi:hypothetical protein
MGGIDSEISKILLEKFMLYFSLDEFGTDAFING